MRYFDISKQNHLFNNILIPLVQHYAAFLYGISYNLYVLNVRDLMHVPCNNHPTIISFEIVEHSTVARGILRTFFMTLGVSMIAFHVKGPQSQMLQQRHPCVLSLQPQRPCLALYSSSGRGPAPPCEHPNACPGGM